MMKTYPLKSISLEEAKEKQFRLVDEISKEFTGREFLSSGDLGVVPGLNKPYYAQKVEKVLAAFFHAEKSLLVTGSGTGAIRWGLCAICKPNDTILIHDAEIFPTTKISMDGLSIKTVRADFNNRDDIIKKLNENPEITGALIQYSRQAIEDSYDMKEVIETIKSVKDIPILTDDNYAAMKVEKVGVELGADLSAISCFKLLGPEGVGLVFGKANYIDQIEKLNYSGGSKVQGHQAMEVLRGLVYAPVSLAIQAEEIEKIINRIKEEKIKGIKDVFIANAQSKVLLIEFSDKIAQKVLKEAEKRGGLPNPVGAESKYEALPLFYKVSGTFLKKDPSLIDTMIRVNPNRAGSDTVIRILKDSIEAAINE